MNLKANILAILILVLINSGISVWYTATEPSIALNTVAIYTNAVRVAIVVICARILLSPRNRP